MCKRVDAYKQIEAGEEAGEKKPFARKEKRKGTRKAKREGNMLLMLALDVELVMAP